MSGKQLHEKKIVIFLNSLTEHERQRFVKFLASPYFNENENLIKAARWLIEKLKTEVPQNNHQHPETIIPDNNYFASEQLYNHLFSGNQSNNIYDPNSLNKILSKLFQLAEQFAAIENLMLDEIAVNNNILSFYDQKHLPKFHENTFKKTEMLIANLQSNKPNYEEKNYQLRADFKQYEDKNFEGRTGNETLKNLNTAADLFFIKSKLILLCDMLQRAEITNIELNYTFCAELLAFLPQSNYLSDNASVNAWYLTLLLMRQPSPENYLNLKNLLLQNPLLPAEELFTLFKQLENMVLTVFTHHPQAMLEMFDLYKYQLEKGFFYTDNILPAALFKNAVTVGIYLNELAWAAWFINAHAQFIHPQNQREETHQFNLAKLYFAQGQYNKVTDILLQYEFQDFYTVLNARRMLLKAYYELNEFLLLDSGLNAYRVFLHRLKNLPANRKANELQFINLLGRLSRVLPNDSQHTKDTVANEIAANPNALEHNWLTAKMNLLQIK